MRVSISLKLSIGFLIALLIMISLSFYSLRVSEQTVKASVGRQSIFLADNLLQNVNNKIFSTIEDLQIEANRPHIKQALTRSAQERRSAEDPKNDKVKDRT